MTKKSIKKTKIYRYYNKIKEYIRKNMPIEEEENEKYDEDMWMPLKP